VNQKLQRNNYWIVNLIFIGILVSIIVYSLLFSADGRKHPVPSGSEWLTGKSAPSTGLSRSFSEIVRFDFREARQYNPFGIRIFLFFFIQLVLRVSAIILMLWFHKILLRPLIIADVFLSVVFFSICFWPFIVLLFHQIARLKSCVFILLP